MPRRFPAGAYPRRGSVYWVALDKKRPAVIVSVDALNRRALDVCVVPLTTVARREFSLRVGVPASASGLKSASWAKCDQVTTVPKTALWYPATGRLPESVLRKIEDAVKIALGLSSAAV